VRHRRFTPVEHAFQYPLFMVCLDLSELDRVFAGRWLWSTRRPALARFRREDHFGDPARPLDECVRDLVRSETGRALSGPILLLTHLRYFGHTMNPVSFYCCLDPAGERLDAVVLEVHNTPWGERHCYALAAPDASRGRTQTYRFAKAFHVSPFMSMDHEYRCRITAPGDRLAVHLENWRAGEKIFDATLGLARRPITGRALAFHLCRFPFMTLQVVAAIYFEALRLWWKRCPYVPHPGTPATRTEAAAHE
jgi:DUF1365 family protein